MVKTLVAGVDMVKFVKPGQQKPYREMAASAIAGAIKEAGIDATLVEQAFAGYVYGDSTCGQRAIYDVFMAGMPIVNVNNNCSSGSSAMFLARQAVLGGVVECALAVGFEEMQPGALNTHWDDRESPFDNFEQILDERNYPKAPVALRCFGAAGHHYLQQYDATPDLFAKVAVKSRNHAIMNPFALFTAPLSEEEVMAAPVVYMDYLTKLMCCPPTCGAAAAIVCNEDFVKRHNISGAVEIVAQAMSTDTEVSWQDPIKLIGSDMTVRASQAVYEQSGIGPEDVDVVELHDCFTVNEVVTYEGLGLCKEGEASAFVGSGDNTYGGKVVVNPSGGLMSKGHPLGATGLAQCYELVNQLRGSAGQRQVNGAKVALQHNLGLGGAGIVTMYKQA